jgi:hypothetical protein
VELEEASARRETELEKAKSNHFPHTYSLMVHIDPISSAKP